LLVAQSAWYYNMNDNDKVAALPRAQVRHAFAVKPEQLAVLSTSVKISLGNTVKSFDAHAATKSSIGK
jgi:hypothetical protein